MCAVGHAVGLDLGCAYAPRQEKYDAVEQEIKRLERTGISPSPELDGLLAARGAARQKRGSILADLLRRPAVGYADLAPFDRERPRSPPDVTESVEISVKYAGYIARKAGRWSKCAV